MNVFSSKTVRRIRELILQLQNSPTANVPSKISEMELTAFDYSDQVSVTEGSTENLDQEIDKTMESKLKLDHSAYVAGDTINGTIIIKAHKPTELKSVDIRLIGKGMTQYFNAKLRAQKLCEVIVPLMSVQEHCTECNKAWSIPFSIKLDEGFPSTMDSGKKGQVIYFISWEMTYDDETTKEYKEVPVLAKHPLDSLPRREEMHGDNKREEEYDLMRLTLYSPASAYLPGEMIQFRATILNMGKKPIKKIAVLLLQNVLFLKSASDFKGRTRSYLMNVKEQSVMIKQYDTREWTDEVQIPDPIPPSANKFHKIDYELVLVAIIKGKKSAIRTVFDQARYHFDLEKYQDDYFRDFLPHACCYFEVGSNHGEKRSASMNGTAALLPLNEVWKLKTKEKKQQRQLPRTASQSRVARITFRP